MKDYLEIANDPMLWVMAIPAVLMVGIQAYLFSKRAMEASKTTSLTKEQCKKSI